MKIPRIQKHLLLTFLPFVYSISANKIACQTRISYPWLNRVKYIETIENRFLPPSGFKRIKVASGSFAQWLRGLPLLPEGSPITDYQGKIIKKADDSTLAAVVNYDIQNKKLEQCIDIIVRFRAEYLKSQQRDDEIAFYLPVNFLLKWNDWKQGFRPHYLGIQVNLIKSNTPDSSRKSFEQYLWTIFYHSNTQTAYFNYRMVKLNDIQIGDFIVKKGSHGHAVLIVDIAIDSNGNKIALIGQGDSPARQFYLLNFKKTQPWFPLNPEDKCPPLPIKKKMYYEGLRRF
jgi:hypothetical protein